MAISGVIAIGILLGTRETPNEPQLGDRPSSFAPSPSPLQPTADALRGTITFGTAYDPSSLEITRPQAEFSLGGPVLWSAVFKQPARSKAITFSLARLSDGDVTVLTEQVTLAAPGVDRVVREAELGTALGGRTGTYEMRYTEEGDLLATGQFSLVEPRRLAANCLPGDQDAFIWSPERLLVLSPCQRIEGTVRDLDAAPDGDRHIYVELDSAFRFLLTPAFEIESGQLVVEPVCLGPFEDDTVEQLCAKDPNPVRAVPEIGDEVWMEGRYVLDTHHFNQGELHPLYRWGALTSTSSPSPEP